MKELNIKCRFNVSQKSSIIDVSQDSCKKESLDRPTNLIIFSMQIVELLKNIKL